MHHVQAGDVIKKLRGKYAACNSYRDSGRLYVPDKPNSEVRFSTAFIRPDHFRLDWSEWHPYFGPSGTEKRYAIWSTPEGTFGAYAYNKGKIEKENSLVDLVDCVAGISHRLAPVIHQLLLGSGNTWLPWTKAATVSTEDLNGVQSYHVASKPTKLGEYSEAWINCNDFRLLRIIQHTVLTVAFQQTVTDYMREKSPAQYAVVKLHLEKFPPKEERYSTVTEYDDVSFDEGLDHAVFNCPGK